MQTKLSFLNFLVWRMWLIDTAGIYGKYKML